MDGAVRLVELKEHSKDVADYEKGRVVAACGVCAEVEGLSRGGWRQALVVPLIRGNATW